MSYFTVYVQPIRTLQFTPSCLFAIFAATLLHTCKAGDLFYTCISLAVAYSACATHSTTPINHLEIPALFITFCSVL